MAQSQSSGSSSGWLGFIAGILVVGLIGAGYLFYTHPRGTEQAQLEINLPDLPRQELPKVDPPHLPTPPAAETNW